MKEKNKSILAGILAIVVVIEMAVILLFCTGVIKVNTATNDKVIEDVK